MAFVANVLRVLVAAPRDAVFEQNTIARCIHDWNALHAHAHGVLFLPLCGIGRGLGSQSDAPVLTDEDVNAFDLVIGAFKREVTSVLADNVAQATVRLRHCRDQRRIVMLFFAELPAGTLPTALADLETTARAFEMTASFRMMGDLTKSVAALLTKSAEARKPSPSKAVSETDLHAPVQIEKYTPRSFVVVGDTRKHKSALREQNGRWIRLKDGRYGWMFSERRRQTVAKIVGL